MTIVVVHGVFNLRAGKSSRDAADELARIWLPDLRAGFAAAGLSNVSLPPLRAAYYADKLTEPEQQNVAARLEDLSPAEQAFAAAWFVELGAPIPAEEQGLVTLPIRQLLDWAARRRGIGVNILSRIAVAFAREAHRYLHTPVARIAARTAVAETIRASRPSVIIAHSLGSVVAYEALHHNRDLSADCLVTVGSPLGLPRVIFDLLDPGPVNRRGEKPLGISQWINLADIGDLIAVPRRLGDRFPVDKHYEFAISQVNFHKMGNYLSSARTATILAPFLL